MASRRSRVRIPSAPPNFSMAHFMQYHNLDSMGRFDASKKGHYIVTNKNVTLELGDHVWLITGEGSPRKYSLCSWFVVDSVEPIRGGQFSEQVSGSVGINFGRFVRVDSLPWFSELQKTAGNFAFGVQHIKTEAIVQGLLGLLRANLEKLEQKSSH